VIQDVEDFHAELSRKPFLYRPVLEQGEIPVPEAIIAEYIPAGGSKRAGWRSDEYGIALREATELRQIGCSSDCRGLLRAHGRENVEGRGLGG
jgi:hypothetical protein